MLRPIQLLAFASMCACGHVASHGDDGTPSGDDDDGSGSNGPTTLDVSPTSIDFGTVSLVAPPDPKTVTITNTGGASTTPSFEFTGTDAASFQITELTCGAALAPGDSCTGNVVLALGHDGMYQASIDVSGGTAPASAALAANSLAAKLDVSPLTDSFDGTLGVTTTRHFTLTNSADAPLPMPALHVTGAAYSLGATTCPALLDAGSNCVFDVDFHPTALGNQTSAATATIDPLVATSNLTGRGTAQLSASHGGSGGGTITGGGLNCGAPPGCVVTVASTPIVLHAAVATGSSFGGWGGSAINCGTNLDCSVDITSGAVGVSANFNDLPTLTVDINEPLGVDGSVTIDPPSMNCTDSCTNDYPAATTVHLSAHFNPGACERFDGWSGACFGQLSTTCTLTVSSNVVTSAGFSIDPTCSPE